MRVPIQHAFRVLATGFAVNALITYALATFIPMPATHRAATGAFDRGWRHAVPTALPKPDLPPHFVFIARHSAITHWQIQHEGPTTRGLTSDYVANISRVGFPFRCVESWSLFLAPGNTLGYTGPVAGHHADILWRTPRLMIQGQSYISQLPLDPLWPGLLGNSILYGLTIAAATAGIRNARAARRRRKGLCTRCAYPVGPTPTCSECGATQPSPPH